MKTFLQVEGKMGPIPQPATNKYRPPQPDTNPKVRKDNAAEKRKRAAPIKRFKPSTTPRPSETAMQPPATVSKVPEAPENRPPPLEKSKFVKALHGLVQEECQGISLRTEIGCFLPTA